ncbi:hypothetical protein [Pseudonocardia thermophila]|uniref:hypothetical protein n=1 Tax=Pseudonocardia thermophila TaxID=1848 RepID=UPI0011610612|nr:hypothetical protein [Pseudonocardia thermophila]
MPRPESLAEVFAQLFAADPGRARRIVEEHQLDAAGRCRACEVRGCTLRAWALDALARRGEVGRTPRWRRDDIERYAREAPPGRRRRGGGELA